MRDREDSFKMAVSRSLSFLRPQRVLVAVRATPLAHWSHSVNNRDEKTEKNSVSEILKVRGTKTQQPDHSKHVVTLSRNLRQSQGRFCSLFLWKVYEAQIGENVLIVLSLAF